MASSTKKDATSVLGILQQAQDNVLRGRTGRARVDNPRPEAKTEVKSETAASEWEALGVRIQSSSSSTATPQGRKALEQEVLESLQQLEPPRIADLVVKAHSSETLRTKEFLDELAQAILAAVPRFRSPDLTRLTSTFATWSLTVGGMPGGAGSDGSRNVKLSETLRSFFQAVSQEVTLRLMDVMPGDLAKLTGALASVDLGSTRLFASIARAAAARGDRFPARDLVTLVASFDQARLFHSALYEALARNLRVNIKDVSAKDAVRGLWSLAMTGTRDEGLGQVVGDNVPKRAASAGLSAEDFCSLAWSFCVLEYHHDQLFRSVFRALEDAAVMASETLCQLYEIHLTLKAFHQKTYSSYELEDETVQSLREHYRKNKGGSLRYKLERTSERIHSDVSEVLRQVMDGSVSTAYQTPLGFTVDLAVMKRRGSSSPIVYLDVDGAQSLVRSLDFLDSSAAANVPRQRGTVLLKRRILKENGFRIAVITEDQWRSLNSDREKQKLLRSVLEKAGVDVR